jgi:hypothetical protein
MSTTFIIISAVITIITGLTAGSDKNGTPAGEIIFTISSAIFLGLIISTFYFHGLKAGAIYAIIAFGVAHLFYRLTVVRK